MKKLLQVVSLVLILGVLGSAIPAGWLGSPALAQASVINSTSTIKMGDEGYGPTAVAVNSGINRTVPQGDSSGPGETGNGDGTDYVNDRSFTTSATKGWSYTGSLQLSRYSFRAATLIDGSVLIEGGFAPGSYTSESETYDPTTGGWTVVGSLHQGRGEHTATLLPDGRVLVAGGYAGPVLNSAELYIPGQHTWINTGSMNAVRTRHSATLLADGRVLVAGGWNGNMTSASEIYNPTSGTWSTTGSMLMTRADHTNILLSTGKVLVAGGAPFNGGHTSEAEVYDPASGTWTATGGMNLARSNFSAVLLPTGKVLVMGGATNQGVTATAELYNPDTGQWSFTGSMHATHFLGTGQEAVLLSDGMVLVAGGYATGTSEIYNPVSGEWTITGSLNTARGAGATALLHDGRVLIAGGDIGPDLMTTTAEIFTYIDPIPVLTSLVPNNGGQGQTLTGILVNGTNLTGAMAITFTGTGVTASDLSVNDNGTQITANITVTGTATEGARDVTVTTPVGTSATLVGGFTVNAVRLVTFPDPNLEAAIRQTLNKPTGDITTADLAGLTTLYAGQRGISDLSGLEHATNLTELYLWQNQIGDISPLSSLTSLTVLYLNYNQIGDISPLFSLTSLTVLGLWGNQISDLSSLSSFTSLTMLDLSLNQISDLSPLSSLTGLILLGLGWNQISDLSPLVANTGFGSGDTVNLQSNPLSADSLNTYIPQLQARGVTVVYDSGSTISGTVDEVSCSHLEGVTLTLSKNGAEVARATSDSSGSYQLSFTETGTCQVVAGKSGFRSETQEITVGTSPVTLDFTGDHSLVPNAPTMSYTLGCVNQWLYPTGDCSLSMSKALSVVNAWLYPVE